MKILSVIIPIFNEEKTIKRLLQQVFKAKLPKLVSKEIIVVDDGSTDQTINILNSEKKIKFTLIKHAKNLGKGAAVRTGLKKAKGNFIIIQDGDLEYNPEDYQRLLKPILENRSEVVYGTRLINYPLKLWGKDKTVLPTHLIANKLLTGLTNLLYGSNLTDMETGYKVFKTSCLKDIKLTSYRFDIEPEITIKLIKAGYTICEVPIQTKPRGYTEGKKIGFLDGIMALVTILKYKFVD